MQPQWIIGRMLECDLVVTDLSVSGRHCRLYCDGPRWMLEDLGSSNGTFVNGVRITGPTEISTTDVVILGLTGQMKWPAAMGRPESAVPEHTPTISAPVMLAFHNNDIVVGRDPSCDHVFDHPLVSRRHARLTRTRTGFTVEDLGSSNGTFVNGVLISQPTPLNIGDVVSLSSYEIRLNLDGLLEQSDLRGRLRIDTHSVTVKVPGKKLIEDVTLTMQPGEFVGLMGPSGAGKTTLMSAMNGYLRPTTGDVLFNGESLYGNYLRFATRMGYVPQDDIIHRDLTVGEALYYTAKLRLPDDYSDADIETCVGNVLDQMGLSAVRDVLIGSAERKGISGGQRKRVNLAMELLTEPLVLFLDEPTSGLSSEDALMVMKVLRSLADSGKTILLTIHQPSLDIFRMLDNLAIISKDSGSSQPGRLTYYGPAYPEAVNFFNPDRTWPAGIEPSPEEVFRGLAQRSTQEWIDRFQQSEFRQTHASNSVSSLELESRESGSAPEAKSRSGGAIAQWKTLVQRYVSIKKRDSWNTFILLAQAPGVALLIAMTFGERASRDASKDLKTWTEVANTVPVTLFVLVLSGLWFGCSNSVREIVGEWSIYRRERMVNLRIPAYVGSKFAVLGLLSALQCLVLLSIVYPACGLKGSASAHFLSLLLVSWIGIGVGLVVSAAAQTSEVAVAMLPVALLPMVMLGGVMMPVHDMQKFARPVAHCVPSRWAFAALVEAESDQQPYAPRPSLPTAVASNLPQPAEVTSRRDMAEKFLPEENGRDGTAAAQLVMMLMLISLYATVHVILWRRDLH